MFNRYAFGILLAMTVIVASQVRADQLDDIKARGKFICGVLAGYEPFGFVDPATGKSVGFEPDICNGIAKHLGVASELKVVTAQGRMPEIMQGRVDAEASLLGWSKEREEQVDYSNVIGTVDSKFLVMKSSGITKADDLADKRIGLAKGSLLEFTARRKYPNATVIAFDDTPAAYLAFRQGKVAALLFTETTIASLKAQDPEGDKAAILPDVIDSSQDAVAVKKGEKRLVEAINQYLNEIEASGEAQKMYDKWFGKDSRLQMTRSVKVGSPIIRD